MPLLISASFLLQLCNSCVTSRANGHSRRRDHPDSSSCFAATRESNTDSSSTHALMTWSCSPTHTRVGSAACPAASDPPAHLHLLPGLMEELEGSRPPPSRPDPPSLPPSVAGSWALRRRHSLHRKQCGSRSTKAGNQRLSGPLSPPPTPAQGGSRLSINSSQQRSYNAHG